MKKYKVVTYEDTVFMDADTFSFGEMFFLIKNDEHVFGCPISELDHFEVVSEETISDKGFDEFVVNTVNRSEGEKIREVIDQYLEDQVRLGNL